MSHGIHFFTISYSEYLKSHEFLGQNKYKSIKNCIQNFRQKAFTFLKINRVKNIKNLPKYALKNESSKWCKFFVKNDDVIEKSDVFEKNYDKRFLTTWIITVPNFESVATGHCEVFRVGKPPPPPLSLSPFCQKHGPKSLPGIGLSFATTSLQSCINKYIECANNLLKTNA